MSDDRLSRGSERAIFEAIVSQLPDPELTRLRRLLLALGAALFVVVTAALFVAGLGWPGVVAFSSTFVPGILVALLVQRRRFRMSPR